MRLSDLALLRRPFSAGEDPELAFPKAVGVNVPEVEALYRQIFNDLDEGVFGIGWWAPHLGTSRRILISHYLLECVRSIRENLTEAALHSLEAVDHWDKESDFLAECVSVEKNKQVSVKVPPRRSPEDDLPRRMATLNAVGFFRAVMGALDCLGASIIGVLALPASIQFADFKTPRQFRSKPTHQLQSDCLIKFDKIVSEAGPTGWAEWVIDFRNMVIHRGRRVHINQIIPRRPPLLGPNGKVIPRMMTAEQLPSDPCRSQIEAFLDNDRLPVLTEHAEATMRGVLDSSVTVVRKVCNELEEVWKIRRATPALLTQPGENWPDGYPSRSTQFDGYRPGTLSFDPALWVSHRDIERQFKSAALPDELRHLWATFD